MTGGTPRETVSFVSWDRLIYVSRGEETLRNIEEEGKQNPLFPAGPVIKCFVMPPSSKVEKKLRRNRFLYAGWLINLSWFQEERPDHVRVESWCCCFAGKLVSFVFPGEFWPRHVTRFVPIGTRTRLLPKKILKGPSKHKAENLGANIWSERCCHDSGAQSSSLGAPSYSC